MPRTSRTARAVNGDATRWTDSEHLLAGIFDAVVHGNWLFHRSHFKGQPRHPDPVTRPGAQGNRIGGKSSYTPREIDRLFKKIRARGVVTDGG